MLAASAGQSIPVVKLFRRGPATHWLKNAAKKDPAARVLPGPASEHQRLALHRGNDAVGGTTARQNRFRRSGLAVVDAAPGPVVNWIEHETSNLGVNTFR